MKISLPIAACLVILGIAGFYVIVGTASEHLLHPASPIMNLVFGAGVMVAFYFLIIKPILMVLRRINSWQSSLEDQENKNFKKDLVV